MHKKNLVFVVRIIPLILIAGFFSCDGWNLEKREDHDFTSFSYSTSDLNDKESWGIIHNDGGYLVVGTTIQQSSSNQDIYLVKINDVGDELWTQSYGTANSEEGSCIYSVENSGSYAVGGNRLVGDNDWQHYLVITNLLGNKTGEYTYGFNKEDKLYSIVQKDGGGYYLCGHSFTWQSANLGSESVIYEIDGSGTEITRYNYGNELANGNDLNDYGHSILRSDDGHVITLNTFEDSHNRGIYDLQLIKHDVDNLASIKWNRTLVENCFKINSSVKRMEDGYIVVAALTSSKLILIRTDIDGNKLWERSYDNADCEYGASVISTSEGGFLIMSSGVTLIKTDADGIDIGRKDYEGLALGNNCVVESDDDGYVFTYTVAEESSTEDKLHITKIYSNLLY